MNIGPRKICKYDCYSCKYLDNIKLYHKGHDGIHHYVCAHPLMKLKVIGAVTYNSDTPNWCPILKEEERKHDQIYRINKL